MHKLLFITVTCLGLLLVSCEKNSAFNEYKELDGGWSKKNKVIFQFNEKEINNKYNLYINVRNNNDYPYNNLFLIVKMNQPDKRVMVDTLEYQMANSDGTLLGNGFSDIKESKLWFKPNFSFPKKGKYIFEIEHAMRQTGKVAGLEKLEGITEVGLELEKIK